MRENVKRIFKNIVILLLLAGVAVLTWLNWFSAAPQRPGDSDSAFLRLIGVVRGQEDQARTLPAYTAYTQSAYPADSAVPMQAILHTQEAFYLYGADGGVDTLFSRIAVPLATALDTLREGRLLTQAQWRSALLGQSLLLRFAGEMPMYYFAAALGALPNEDLDFDMCDLLLDLSGDTVLLLARTGDGIIYAYNTGLRSLNRQTLTADFEPSDARFACEVPELLGRVPDETIIAPGSIEAPQLAVSPVLTDFSGASSERVIDAVLDALGFNTYTVASYIESDATHVYVEEMRTMRLSSGGTLVYNDASQEAIKPMTNIAMSVRTQNIGASAQIMEKAMVPYLGDAKAYIARQYYDEATERYVVIYRVQYAGCRVDLSGGYLARFEFRGTTLVGAYMNLLGFTAADTSDVLLPSVYAAAAAGSGEAAESLEIRYQIRQGTARGAWMYD